MAAAAGNLCMHTHQWKKGFVVVKIAPIRVQPIMAGQATIPEGDRMRDGEGTVKLRMAGLAGSFIELSEIVADMAIAAGKGSSIWLTSVGFQRIALGLMKEFESAQVSQRGIQAAMVGVTGPAGSPGIGEVQRAMQPGRVRPLGRYIRVTSFAAFSHPGIKPERRMAPVALTGNLCMGFYTPQCGSRLAVERAGVKDHASGGKGEPCHDQGGKNCCHQAGGGQATKRRFLHRSANAARWHNITPRRYG